jgi:hypothetical protein
MAIGAAGGKLMARLARVRMRAYAGGSSGHVYFKPLLKNHQPQINADTF